MLAGKFGSSPQRLGRIEPDAEENLASCLAGILKKVPQPKKHSQQRPDHSRSVDSSRKEGSLPKCQYLMGSQDSGLHTEMN